MTPPKQSLFKQKIKQARLKDTNGANELTPIQIDWKDNSRISATNKDTDSSYATNNHHPKLVQVNRQIQDNNIHTIGQMTQQQRQRNAEIVKKELPISLLKRIVGGEQVNQGNAVDQYGQNRKDQKEQDNQLKEQQSQSNEVNSGSKMPNTTNPPPTHPPNSNSQNNPPNDLQSSKLDNNHIQLLKSVSLNIGKVQLVPTIMKPNRKGRKIDSIKSNLSNNSSQISSNINQKNSNSNSSNQNSNNIDEYEKHEYIQLDAIISLMLSDNNQSQVVGSHLFRTYVQAVYKSRVKLVLKRTENSNSVANLNQINQSNQLNQLKQKNQLNQLNQQNSIAYNIILVGSNIYLHLNYVVEYLFIMGMVPLSHFITKTTFKSCYLQMITSYVDIINIVKEQLSPSSKGDIIEFLTKQVKDIGQVEANQHIRNTLLDSFQIVIQYMKEQVGECHRRMTTNKQRSSQMGTNQQSQVLSNQQDQYTSVQLHKYLINESQSYYVPLNANSLNKTHPPIYYLYRQILLQCLYGSNYEYQSLLSTIELSKDYFELENSFKTIIRFTYGLIATSKLFSTEDQELSPKERQLLNSRIGHTFKKYIIFYIDQHKQDASKLRSDTQIIKREMLNDHQLLYMCAYCLQTLQDFSWQPTYDQKPHLKHIMNIFAIEENLEESQMTVEQVETTLKYIDGVLLNQENAQTVFVALLGLFEMESIFNSVETEILIKIYHKIINSQTNQTGNQTSGHIRIAPKQLKHLIQIYNYNSFGNVPLGLLLLYCLCTSSQPQEHTILQQVVMKYPYLIYHTAQDNQPLGGQHLYQYKATNQDTKQQVYNMLCVREIPNPINWFIQLLSKSH